MLLITLVRYMEAVLIGKASTSLGQNDVVEETSSGFLGGIMRKLPPILRRPARNLAQQVSIRNPLLAILNGQINTLSVMYLLIQVQ